jgi:hypothetical protein
MPARLGERIAYCARKAAIAARKKLRRMRLLLATSDDE